MKKKILYIIFIGILFCFSNNVVNAASLKEEAQNYSCEDLISKEILKKQNESVLFDGSGYDANCIYYITDKVKKNQRCAILQFAFNEDGSYKIDRITIRDDLSGTHSPNYIVTNKNNDGSLNQFFKDRVGSCPSKVSYYSDDNKIGIVEESFILDTNSDSNFKDAKEMRRLFYRSREFIIPPVIIPGNGNEVTSCADSIGEEGVKLLKGIKNIFMLIVPILLVILGIIDMTTAVFSGDENNMKKCQNKFIKRIVIALVIFITPILLHQLLLIADKVWGNIDTTMCGIF